MSVNQFSRTEMLLGKGFTEKVSEKKVILFGLGGVGSYAAEALARAGIGSITLVDSDRVSLTNLNRQLCALHSTVGRYKTEVVAEHKSGLQGGMHQRILPAGKFGLIRP